MLFEFPICTEEKLGKKNNSAHLRECFIEKLRKKYKKQPFSRCSRSKLHFDEMKSMSSILQFVSLK
jgi:hypothetical protein